MATLVAADGYFRPSETLALQRQDFYHSSRGRTPCSVVVAREVPAKNKQFDDGFAVSGHDRQCVRELVTALKEHVPKLVNLL